MAVESKAPDIFELVKKWAFEHFGIAGLIAILILLGAFGVFKNWDKAKTWPGIATLLARWRRWPVPKADPHRYSILVAHLENDPQREHKRLIIEALKEFEGVQTLSLDRTISLEGPVPEEMEKRGQKETQRYLKESGASVLIWGAVLSRESSTVYKLYWTPAAGEARKPERYAAPLAEAQLRLPEVFWGDLAEIMRLQVTLGEAEFEAQQGRYIADRLPPFIARVEKLFQASGGRPGWDAGAKGATLVTMGNALGTLGEQSGKRNPLRKAIHAYKEALQEYTRERVPFYWAMAQNNLGNALRNLGERENSTARLEEAVAAFREALKERTRERVPLEWVMTQNNIGLALATLGKRESGKVRLEGAVAAFREALKERTRERVPLEWAMTQNNLGNALRSLGERESGTVRLEEAVQAFREALKEYIRERVPREWAMTQNNLGNVLESLGELERGTNRFEEAVEAYREALKERTREQVPLDWAVTQNNLGFTLLRLGEREEGTEWLKEAMAAYIAALEVFGPAKATYYTQMAVKNLLRTEALLRERQK